MKIKSGYLGTRKLCPQTLMMSHGYDPRRSEGSVKPPIILSSTFEAESAEELERFFQIATGAVASDPSRDPLGYARINQPNMEMFEDRLALWDEAEACAAFGSGMAAIDTLLRSFVRQGDIILYSEPLYGGTDGLIKKILPEEVGTIPIGFTHTDTQHDIMNKVLEAGGPHKVAVVFVETPSNPTNTLVDLGLCARLTAACNQYKRSPYKDSPPCRMARLVVDNTFLGPLFQRPLSLGADLAVYSCTKFIGGHSDVIAGACVGKKEDIAVIKKRRSAVGDMLDPTTAWLLKRSLETLELRMRKQAENAACIAQFLAEHKKITHVHYLGLLDKKSQQYGVYEKQCTGPGSMISFEVEGGKQAAFRFLNELGIVKLAVSLGSTESLAQCPARMTHLGVDQETKNRLGITDSMIRLSVGLEDPDDLIYDLDQALAAL